MAAAAALFSLVAHSSFVIRHSSFVIRHSLRPRPSEHDGNRTEQDFEIQPERPVVNVLEVQAHPVFELDDLIATADLPQAGEAGLDAEAPAVGQIMEASDFVHGQGPWTDEAHLAAQDVEKLRQLINA